MIPGLDSRFRLQGLQASRLVAGVRIAEVGHRCFEDARPILQADREEAFPGFGGEDACRVLEELEETAVVDLGLTPVGREQMADFGADRSKLLEEDLGLLVDADGIPDGFTALQ